MPVYEYRCTQGHQYEKTQGFEAPSEHKCLTCGSIARRQISLPAVIFKGSGFYSTDNRKSSTSNGSASAGSSDVKSESASSTPEHGPPHGDGSHPHGTESKAPAKAEAAVD